jgi:hypothetical protein
VLTDFFTEGHELNLQNRQYHCWRGAFHAKSAAMVACHCVDQVAIKPAIGMAEALFGHDIKKTGLLLKG